ncbi:MAG: hypothetical protein LUG13_05545 [Oscillospiraceae bacterium]|nr:hypothetical protein [Oscillospiraceae bacterium]
MEKPNDIKEIKLDYIISYVQDKGQWAVDWLKELVNKEMPPNKNGKPRKITFIEIRNEFVKQFMPELLPPPKKKEPSMFDKINNL